jgi:hypothetical protein
MIFWHTANSGGIFQRLLNLIGIIFVESPLKLINAILLTCVQEETNISSCIDPRMSEWMYVNIF